MKPKDLIKLLQNIEKFRLEYENEITNGLCYQDISEQMKNAKLKQKELINDLLHTFFRYQMIYLEIEAFKSRIEDMSDFKF